MSRNCPTDASKYMVAIHFWLLPLASSRFHFAGACPRSKDIFPLNQFPRHRKIKRENLGNGLSHIRDTVANPSCMAAKDTFLLKFRHGKSQ